MIYIELFWSFVQVGLFSIGGGYAALPLIQHQVVDVRGWMTLTELSDMITISQMTPGPIALNAATFVGVRQAGIPGAVVATFSCIFPCVIIVSLLAFIYYRYKKMAVIQGVLEMLRPATVSLIASAGLSIIILAFWGESGFMLSVKAIDFVAVGLFAVALLALRKFKASSIWVILGCGVVGCAFYMFLP